MKTLNEVPETCTDLLQFLTKYFKNYSHQNTPANVESIKESLKDFEGQKIDDVMRNKVLFVLKKELARLKTEQFIVVEKVVRDFAKLKDFDSIVFDMSIILKSKDQDITITLQTLNVLSIVSIQTTEDLSVDFYTFIIS